MCTRSNSRTRLAISRAIEGEYPNLEGHFVAKNRTSKAPDFGGSASVYGIPLAPHGDQLPGRSRSLLNSETWTPWRDNSSHMPSTFGGPPNLGDKPEMRCRTGRLL